MVKTIWCQLTNKDSFCINKNCFFMIEMVVKLQFLWLKHVDVSGFRYIWGVHRGLGHVQPRFPLPLHLQVPISRLYLSFDHLSRWFVCYLKNTISEVLKKTCYRESWRFVQVVKSWVFRSDCLAKTLVRDAFCVKFKNGLEIIED